MVCRLIQVKKNGSPRPPQQQPTAEQEQGQQEDHEGVAHDLAHMQARYRQQGDGPGSE